MKRTLSLHALAALTTILVSPLGLYSCAVADEPAAAKPAEPAIKLPPFEKEIQAFEEKDKTTPPPADAVLFIGSSSIRRWTTLAKDFSEIPVINRGFGGSQLSDSVRNVSRIVTPYKPRLIVIYAGSNDIAAKKTPAKVLADFQEFVAKVRAAQPEVPIAFISINPSIKRWAIDNQNREANRLIAEYTRTQPKLTFIDSYTGMLGADGQPRKEQLVEDGLHLNADGYKSWATIVKPQILKLYAETKSTLAP